MERDNSNKDVEAPKTKDELLEDLRFLHDHADLFKKLGFGFIVPFREKEIVAELQVRFPDLPPAFKVHPSISWGQDTRPIDYYLGNVGRNYTPLPISFRSHRGPGQDIRPIGYHSGGPGPNLPPAFRPKGPLG